MVPEHGYLDTKIFGHEDRQNWRLLLVVNHSWDQEGRHACVRTHKGVITLCWNDGGEQLQKW